MVIENDTSCGTCPRCRLRGMLTTALAGHDRDRYLELLLQQLLETTKAVRRVQNLDPSTIIGSIAVDLAVEELIVACDCVYQVADGDEAADTMPAGRYWVGDLCYVLHDAWGVVPFEDGIHTLPDGRRIAKFGTVHGDGVYGDDQGREYLVDSGSLGCILAADIRDTDANFAPDGGEYVEVDTPFTPRRTYPRGALPDCDGGVLELAGVRINLDADGEGDD